VEALLEDGRIDLRAVFAEASPRASAMTRLSMDFIQSPQFELNPLVLARLPLRLWQTFRQLSDWYVNPPDIVHVTMLSPIDIILLQVAFRSRALVLVTVHDAVMHIGEESWFHEILTKHLIARSDGVVVLSQYAEAVLRPRLPLDKPLYLMKQGLIVNAAKPSPPKQPPSPGEPLKLLFFGRIVAYKGLDLLLSAIKLIRKRGGPKVHLTIAGSGDLSTYNEAIVDLGDVELHVDGWMSDAQRNIHFNAAHVQVLPYIDTSVSGVVLTGIWAGMATVATPLPAFHDILEEGVNAVFASEVSAPALADAISRLAEDHSLLKILAQGANKSANAMCAQFVAENWIRLFHKITANES
jgi:glycosyltransferase involved in cell wall biosynthesis